MVDDAGESTINLPLTAAQAKALLDLAELGIKKSDSVDRGAIDLAAGSVAVERLRVLIRRHPAAPKRIEPNRGP